MYNNEIPLFFEYKGTEIVVAQEACQIALRKGDYLNAFSCAKRLEQLISSIVEKEMLAYYKKCAEAGISEAMIETVHLLIDKKKRLIKPQAFPYLKKLSDSGYIESFEWLGDCYYYGIGCEKDLRKAMQSYFEAVLFGDAGEYCKKKLRRLDFGRTQSKKDDMTDNIIKALIFYDTGFLDSWNARVKLAEMILDGVLKEYSPEAAVHILKAFYKKDLIGYADGIAGYRLGECLLNGLGTDKNPFVALNILGETMLDIEDIADNYDEYSKKKINECFHENYDFNEVKDKINKMREEASEEVRKTQEVNGYLLDEDDIFEKWKKESTLIIKRRKCSEYDKCGIDGIFYC